MILKLSQLVSVYYALYLCMYGSFKKKKYRYTNTRLYTHKHTNKHKNHK